MSDIPDDVMKIARDAFTEVANTYGTADEMAAPIARVILNERKEARAKALEEAAQVAEVYQIECEQTARGLRRLKDYARSKQVEREAHASGVIAANIRALQSEER